MGRPKKVVTEEDGKDNPSALSLKELEDKKPITERELTPVERHALKNLLDDMDEVPMSKRFR